MFGCSLNSDVGFDGWMDSMFVGFGMNGAYTMDQYNYNLLFIPEIGVETAWRHYYIISKDLPLLVNSKVCPKTGI